MKNNDTFILKPQCTYMLDESNYPIALIHVDCFSNMHTEDDIYSRLYHKGEIIKVRFTVKEVEA